MFDGWLKVGFERAGRTREGFDVAPFSMCFVGDDVQNCRDLAKPTLALYIGGMGARSRNFYFDLVERYGYESAAAEVQDRYLEGKKVEAAMAVPDELVDDVALVGPPERIRERLSLWREAGVDTLIVGVFQVEALRVLAEAVL
jgi:alkanesulfonate monooxygenase SsuD/methylene tetrahydromethanopterin reductase-like flavin-dependent oxidoreductase (luciferase family)